MRLYGVVLGERNQKIGEVLNFSLPSITTCPGATPWCRQHCYGQRFERLRPKCRHAYEENLLLAQDTEHFIKTMTGVIPRIAPCFRIHVTGDFFSVDYINSWFTICSELPQVAFWTYTRTWTNPELLPALERLRALANVTLFASVDTGMPQPPPGWRVAWIEGDPRAKGLPCREQTDPTQTCQVCKYCYTKNAGDVIFRVR